MSVFQAKKEGEQLAEEGSWRARLGVSEGAGGRPPRPRALGGGRSLGQGWPAPPAPLSSLLQEPPPAEPAQGRARAPPSPG